MYRSSNRNCASWFVGVLVLVCLLSGCSVNQRSQDVVTQSKAASVGDWKDLRLGGEPLLHEVKRNTAILFGPADGVQIDSKITESGLDVNMVYRGRGNPQMGSAVPISRDGYFITAAHCVDGPPMALISFQEDADGNPRITKLAVRVVWQSPVRYEPDLAVIHVPVRLSRPFSLLPPGELEVGARVAVTGYSGLGDSSPFSASEAAGRILGISESDKPTSWRVISHDAPLTEGDSGGPLVDRQGRLVGINVQLRIRRFGQLRRAGSARGLGYFGEAVAPDPAWLQGIIDADRKSRS